MNEILDNLYISSLENANNESLLELKGISFIISIGCEISHNAVNYVSFPSVLDTTDSILLDIFIICNSIILTNRDKGIKTLVNCVYGQSRSAAVICGYLLFLSLTESKYSCLYPSVSAIINYVKKCHPSVCINPGFLCQLLLCWTRKMFYSNECVLLSSDNQSKYKANFNILDSYQLPLIPSLKFLKSSSSQYRIVCKKCKATLGTDCDIINNDIMFRELLEKYADEFWKDYYIPLNPNVIRLEDIKEYLPLSSFDENLTIKNETRSGEGTVLCLSCRTECGVWKKNCLSLCEGYLTGDLLAFVRKTVELRRLKFV